MTRQELFNSVQSYFNMVLNETDKKKLNYYLDSVIDKEVEERTIKDQATIKKLSHVAQSVASIVDKRKEFIVPTIKQVEARLIKFCEENNADYQMMIGKTRKHEIVALRKVFFIQCVCDLYWHPYPIIDVLNRHRTTLYHYLSYKGITKPQVDILIKKFANYYKNQRA